MGLLDYLKKKRDTEVNANDGYIKSGQVNLIDDVLDVEEKMEQIRKRNKKKKQEGM